MGLFDDAVPGGSIAKPLMIALGALLVGKMLTGGSSSQEQAPATATPAAGTGDQSGGWGSGLGGGLGGLLDKLSGAGHSEVANSWVGAGQNAPIQPAQLGTALGQSTIADLAKASGMSEQDLLAQLSHALPGVVDKLTPNGKVPSQSDIQALLSR
jgi:uncharacterized protein YidB (DUF937 family)